MNTPTQKDYGRREFIRSTGISYAAVPLLPLVAQTVLAQVKAAARSVASMSPEEAARDENFWFTVQQAYDLDSRYIILNAGSSNPVPRQVMDAFIRYVQFVNGSPLLNNRTLEAQQETVRRRLARMVNCTPDEIAITRNTTEAINTVISGMELNPSDEVLTTEYDYYMMLHTWHQYEKRRGVVLKTIPISWPVRDQKVLLTAFEKAITPKTRVIHCSHVVDAMGHIMPVRQICDLAHARGIQVIVDGALGFGHVVCDMKAFGCDYYGTSLHKWVSAPLGTGFLYVKRERIKDLWPLYGSTIPQSDDIRKFEQIGRHPVSSIAAIGQALDFYEMIGPARKQARLHYLKRYWADKLAGVRNIRINTSLEAEHSCATIHVGIDGVDPQKLSRYLLDEHGIYVFALPDVPVKGVYVSPNVFTRLNELDLFVEAMSKVAINGLPA